MPHVVVRYFAAARTAAGVREETVTADSIDDVLVRLRSRHDQHFAAVLGASSLLVDGVRTNDLHALVADDIELDVLPPFAGG